jgi:prepilin-type N-terminal cleavage/methylation domain-containing protein
MPAGSSSRRPFGFTLIELLTVIAIIGILAAIIIPTVGKVRQSARTAQASSNLRQLAVATFAFASDNKGRAPSGAYRADILPYIGAKNATSLFVSPNAALPIPATELAPISFAMNLWISNIGSSITLSSVTRPSSVILLADTAQVPRFNNNSSATLTPAWGFRSIPGGAALTDPLPGGDRDEDTDAAQGYFRYRNSGRALAAWADGSVRSFLPGELTYANIAATQ